MGGKITHWFHQCHLKSSGEEGSLLRAGYGRRLDRIELAASARDQRWYCGR